MERCSWSFIEFMYAVTFISEPKICCLCLFTVHYNGEFYCICHDFTSFIFHIPKDDQGDLTIASVSGQMILSSDPDISTNVSLQNKTPSAANNTVNVFLNIKPGNTEQISDPTQIQRGIVSITVAQSTEGQPFYSI